MTQLKCFSLPPKRGAPGLDCVCMTVMCCGKCNISQGLTLLYYCLRELREFRCSFVCGFLRCVHLRLFGLALRVCVCERQRERERERERENLFVYVLYVLVCV